MLKTGMEVVDERNPLEIRDSPGEMLGSQADSTSSEVARLRGLRTEPVVLRLSHIGKSYPIAGSDERVVALKDMTLAERDDGTTSTASMPNSVDAPLPPFAPVRRGEFVMIRGPSGGGKTTLLNIIGTIDSCTEGVIELNGRQIDKNTRENVLADIRLKSLGFVFQTFNLIATMTAAENVELPMTLLGKLSNKEMRLRSRQLLTLVGLRNRINHLPSELSGGEQQRVTIARSLANNPSLLLLDEPTGDLDTANTIEIMDLLIRINRRTKTTCIMVTHNPDIECYADRILYVSDGRFGKEVYNTAPTCLNLEKYTKYLAEKEKEITGLMQRQENTPSDAKEVEKKAPPPPPAAAAAAVGGRAAQLEVQAADELHCDTRDNDSFINAPHDPNMSSPFLQQRRVSDTPADGLGNASRSTAPTGTYSRASAHASASGPAVGLNSSSLRRAPQPAWQRERASFVEGESASVAPARRTSLDRVAQREEREANLGM